MAQILVLMSSPRKKGNTDQLAEAFIKGAKDKGYSTKKVYVNDLSIQTCLGCNACQKIGHCVKKDDMQEVYNEMLEAQVIVYASPVYFYTFNGAMKLLMDRTFAIEKTIHNKDFYLLSTGLAPSEDYFSVIQTTFEKYIQCFRAGKNRIVGHVFGLSTGDKNDIKKTDALDQAYKLAKEIEINE